MKKLLTVMATVVCICLAMGFTVTDNSTNDTKTGTNLRKQITKWKNTTWVNPWLNEKRFNTPKKSFAYNIMVNNAVSDPSVLQVCSLIFPGGGYDLRTSGGNVPYEIPTGQTVSFIGLVDGSNGHMMVIQLIDMDTLELLYSYGGPSVVYQWTPQVGKKYYLWVEYF